MHSTVAIIVEDGTIFTPNFLRRRENSTRKLDPYGLILAEFKMKLKTQKTTLLARVQEVCVRNLYSTATCQETDKSRATEQDAVCVSLTGKLPL